jgi:hypothetical protein
MTFDDLLIELDVTREERTAMVWHLAAMRARRTVEVLMDDTAFKARRAAMPGALRDTSGLDELRD